MHLHLPPEVPQPVHCQLDLLGVGELPDGAEESEEGGGQEVEVGGLDGGGGDRAQVVPLLRLRHILRLQT